LQVVTQRKAGFVARLFAHNRPTTRFPEGGAWVFAGIESTEIDQVPLESALSHARMRVCETPSVLTLHLQLGADERERQRADRLRRRFSVRAIPPTGTIPERLAWPLILNADVMLLIASPKYLMEAIPTTNYQ